MRSRKQMSMDARTIRIFVKHESRWSGQCRDALDEPLEPVRVHWDALIGCSGQFGSGRAVELAAPTRLAPLGRSNWLIELASSCARIRRSRPLGCAGTIELVVRPFWISQTGCSSPLMYLAWLGRSNWQLEPPRRRWGFQIGRSSLFRCRS